MIGSHDIENCPLREIGYVFWDTERILCPAVNRKHQQACRMDSKILDRLFNRREGKSAEQRLKGVKLPHALMKRIIKEFGSTALDDEDDEDDEWDV